MQLLGAHLRKERLRRPGVAALRPPSLANRAARRRTLESSRASSSARSRSGGGSSRRATAGCVEVGAGHLFRGLKGAAAREDREAPEELLLAVREKVVRPLDRRSERLLAGVGVAAALSRSSRCETRSRIWAGERAFVRAAANSTASGSESSCAQSSAISSEGSICARSEKRATASGSARGWTANSTSPRGEGARGS